MSAGRTIVAIIVCLLVVAVIGVVAWLLYARRRAQRLGLPPPTLLSILHLSPPVSAYGAPQPAPGGIVGWVNDKIRSYRARRNRTAAGAYEDSLYSGAGPSVSGQQPRPGRRGFGPLDPDEAWDARVGTEADGYGAYYEENELQDRPGAAAGPYEGGSYTMNLPVTPRVQAADATSGPSLAAGGEQERGRTREREPAGLAPDAARKVNPFDDDAEPSNMSLRGISPRPLDESAGGNGKRDNSPTGRRSVFREDM